MDLTTTCTIRKPAHFLEKETSIPFHLLGSLGPGDHGKPAPKAVQQSQVRVQSPNPMESDDSNLDHAASAVSMGDNPMEADQSPPPTPCNSHESSPVTRTFHPQDDSVVELEASQDELDWDESMELPMEASHESHTLHHQLHEKCKQVKKAEKQARIQELHSQLAETNHQLDVLRQKASCVREGYQSPGCN